MPIDDRRAVVSIVEETHALLGNSLATDVPPFLVIRLELLDPLQQLLEQPLVDDQTMVALMRPSYFELIGNVQAVQELLLGQRGEELDSQLIAAGLAGQQLALKIAGFRRELSGVLQQPQRLLRKRRVRRATKWANIVLGTLTSIPLVGTIVEPLKEFKETVETQLEQETDA